MAMALLRIVLLGLGAALSLLGAGAGAQGFPSRPVRMVVPFPPGSASDFLARVLGQKMTEAWGQQIVIDNRPGAGGLIGGTVIAKANPDGYTIGLVGQPHLTAVLLSKSPPWDSIKDFAHIGLVASMPNVVTVGPGLQVNSLSDMLSQLKARPGHYNVGSAGVGSSSHLAAEMFNAAAGVKAVHVPFKLLSDALAELYGGRIHYYLYPLPAAMPALREGKIRPIATGGKSRTVALPKVPTMAEAGMPGFVSESYFGLLGPAGIPKPVVGKINGEMVRILKTEDVRHRYLQNGAEPAPTSPDGFQKVQLAEQARVRKVIRDIGLKPHL
jgi:tripartite-type tricarboxylate transporter receptor subunit TctC